MKCEICNKEAIKCFESTDTWYCKEHFKVTLNKLEEVFSNFGKKGGRMMSLRNANGVIQKEQ